MNRTYPVRRVLRAVEKVALPGLTAKSRSKMVDLLITSSALTYLLLRFG